MTMHVDENRPLTADEKKEIRRAAEAIDNSIDWQETEEGFSYWSEVYSKLLKISDEPCDKCGK